MAQDKEKTGDKNNSSTNIYRRFWVKQNFNVFLYNHEEVRKTFISAECK